MEMECGKLMNLNLTEEQKVKLLETYFEGYYSTNQDTEKFAAEAYYAMGEILKGNLPMYLRHLLVYDLYGNLIEIVPNLKGQIESNIINEHVFDVEKIVDNAIKAIKEEYQDVLDTEGAEKPLQDIADYILEGVVEDYTSDNNIELEYNKFIVLVQQIKGILDYDSIKDSIMEDEQ